ncbi:hypothetical protein ACJX0J_031980, partial [Zea mays]
TLASLLIVFPCFFEKKIITHLVVNGQFILAFSYDLQLSDDENTFKGAWAWQGDWHFFLSDSLNHTATEIGFEALLLSPQDDYQCGEKKPKLTAVRANMLLAVINNIKQALHCQAEEIVVISFENRRGGIPVGMYMLYNIHH